MQITLNNIATILQLDSIPNGDQILNLSPAFDSRNLSDARQTLFFAFGSKGALSAKDAFDKGCRVFICEQALSLPSNQAQIFKVDNTLIALQKLAKFIRQNFHNPVIGITGSNGKTIVKEWIAQFAAPEIKITKNPASYNSQMGVPISVLYLEKDSQAAIFEAGISEPNEMKFLRDIIQPNIGIFTFLGDAHDQNFESKHHKLIEKIKLFESTQTIICEYQSPAWFELKLQFPDKNLIGVSAIHADADLFLQSKDKQIQWTYKGKAQEAFYFQRHDNASILNLALAIAGALQLNISIETILRTIPILALPQGRLRLQNGINNSKILNDSYSADLQSLKIALEELNQMPESFSRTLILSDFQAHSDKAHLYKEIAALCNLYHAQKVILIGPDINEFAGLFHNHTSSFLSTQDALEELNPEAFQNEVILIKGSRACKLEKIAALLEAQNHECTLEINLDAISNNFKQFKNKLDPKTKLMVMVKAFSYGAGSVEMARHLEYLGADYLAVAYADEGVQIRKAGISLPIMVMSPELPSLNALHVYHLEPEIFSFKSLKLITNEIDNLGLENTLPIHIKIDTGMHRLGFMPNEIDELIHILKLYPQLKIASIFTHLVGAEDEKLDEFSQTQIQRFKLASQQIISAIGYTPLLHYQNSSGIARFSDPDVQMARLGIGIYGYSSEVALNKTLQEALTFKTVISALREIEEPETVGYNRRGKITGKRKIATISVGYADGFSRKLGLGNYQVLIANHLCPTIGSVCMDMTMIDVTNVACQEGDEVIIFGPTLSVDLMAQKCETITYEIFTSIGQRVKRIYMKE